MARRAARLILLPADPAESSGYGKGVRADIERLKPTDDDRVIVFGETAVPADPRWVLLPRGSNRLRRRAFNMARGRASAEPLMSELKPLLAGWEFEQLFLDETIFYRPMKALYPDRPMTVRFHNFFAMARYRQHFRQYRIRPMLRYNLEAFFRLERLILSDTLVTSIFVTEEEQKYCLLAFPDLRSECWPNSMQIRKGVPKPPSAPPCQRLVYLGGLPSHTKPGVDYLVAVVFPRLKALCPGAELHLFGHGTEQYENPGASVRGHGYYAGSGYPCEGLYVVPDLLGVGIKIKVGDLFMDGMPFIVTPFGTEGYRLPESEHVLIADIDSWPRRIAEYFKGQGLAPCPSAP